MKSRLHVGSSQTLVPQDSEAHPVGAETWNVIGGVRWTRMFHFSDGPSPELGFSSSIAKIHPWHCRRRSPPWPRPRSALPVFRSILLPIRFSFPAMLRICMRRSFARLRRAADAGRYYSAVALSGSSVLCECALTTHHSLHRPLLLRPLLAPSLAQRPARFASISWHGRLPMDHPTRASLLTLQIGTAPPPWATSLLSLPRGSSWTARHSPTKTTVAMTCQTTWTLKWGRTREILT